MNTGVPQPWQPYQEPLRATLVRTIAIAVLAGALVSIFWTHGLARWPAITVLMLWPSFGGHWIELWFLNWLRPRLPADRTVQIVARLATWFAAGCALGFGMGLSAMLLLNYPPSRWPSWWIAGVGLIVVELIAHAALQRRGQPSFYNGRG